MANVYALRLEVLKVCEKKICPYDIMSSKRCKGVLSNVEVIHSPRRIRNKYSSMIILQVPRNLGLGKAATMIAI